ncbi:ribonuclease III [Athelia psychrophila]|uniref:Ribonuclease III n=1 Tax=Athelia psychrophila TaxID=1759441 RepID=A0A166CAG8_9AGAM|nr:ribonuclease III [Fibularhizoctonia sp. CBS 109695]
MALKPQFEPGEFPDLPEIFEKGTKLQVFTHRSFYARSAHVFEDRADSPSQDNEKYEHLGDSVLGLVVTSLLIEMYPYLRVGPSTKIRAMMVGNATLAEISLKYKLPDRLRLHPAQAVTLRASANVQADVFESYIGGLYVDQGLDAVKAWLNQLFRPYSKLAYSLVREQHGLSSPSLQTEKQDGTANVHTLDLARTTLSGSTTIGHLSLFNQNIQKADKAVEWVYSGGADGEGKKNTPIWAVKVLVDGECLGQGKGLSKKGARNEAAKQGLEGLGIHV